MTELSDGVAATHTELICKALEDAIREAERLSSIEQVDKDKVILVVSEDIYIRILANRPVELIHRRPGPDGTSYYPAYHGYRIGMIDDNTICTFAASAMIGMQYYPGMEVGDTIVVGPDNELWGLTSIEPVIFRSIGLTVTMGGPMPSVNGVSSVLAGYGITEDPLRGRLLYYSYDGAKWQEVAIDQASIRFKNGHYIVDPFEISFENDAPDIGDDLLDEFIQSFTRKTETT